MQEIVRKKGWHSTQRDRHTKRVSTIYYCAGRRTAVVEIEYKTPTGLDVRPVMNADKTTSQKGTGDTKRRLAFNDKRGGKNEDKKSTTNKRARVKVAAKNITAKKKTAPKVTTGAKTTKTKTGKKKTTPKVTTIAKTANNKGSTSMCVWVYVCSCMCVC